jgi:Domain of unknown function (DUF1330)
LRAADAGGASAKQVTAFDGTAPKRAVVQVWDSVEKIQAWRNDQQFKELRQIGEKYAKFRAFAIEGVAQIGTRHIRTNEAALSWRPRPFGMQIDSLAAFNWRRLFSPSANNNQNSGAGG